MKKILISTCMIACSLFAEELLITNKSGGLISLIVQGEHTHASKRKYLKANSMYYFLQDGSSITLGREEPLIVQWIVDRRFVCSKKVEEQEVSVVIESTQQKKSS